MVKVIWKDPKDPKNLVNIRNKPNMDAKSIVGQAREGEAFTIKRICGAFYELASGLYITNNKKYVTVIKK